MGSPAFKVYDVTGTYQAACKEPEAAAALMAFYGGLGPGATIRYQHGRVLWTEGVDGHAAESYDTVAATVYTRLRVFQAESYARAYVRREEVR
jgi:hypothetical protein